MKGIKKCPCVLWKQFYWKEIPSVAGEHSRKPPSCLSFALFQIFSKLLGGGCFFALLDWNIQKYCQHFVRWSNIFKCLLRNKTWIDFSSQKTFTFGHCLPRLFIHFHQGPLRYVLSQNFWLKSQDNSMCFGHFHYQHHHHHQNYHHHHHNQQA